MKLWCLILAVVLTACTYNEGAMGELDDLGKQQGTGGWGQSRAMVTGDKTPRSVQAAFADHGWPAGTFTVQFDLTGFQPDPTTNQQLAPPRCEAQITWSINGNDIVRKVSVASGMAITGVAEAVSVQLVDVTVPHGAVPPAGQLGAKYSVATLIAPGPRATWQNPPYLDQNDAPSNGSPRVITPGNVFDFPVPDDAGVISAYVAVSFDPTVVGSDASKEQAIQASHIAADTLTTFFLKIYDPRAFEWVPLSPGCNAVRIANNSNQDINVAVIWGIQG